MIRFSRSCAALRIVALSMCAALPLPASACAGVGGTGARIQVVDESAIIVWDAATHQERFIRRAAFNATGDSFGFLVPTPSVPRLTETSNTVFHSLERMIQPKVIEHKKLEFDPISVFAAAAHPKSAGVPLSAGEWGGLSHVHVMDTQYVGGYDAVVLSADNVASLKEWLQSHDYVAQPELLAWLTPYIQAHWNITAFKISTANPHYRSIGPRYGSVAMASTAVEMTFTTDHPFFPYREPANQRTKGNYGERSLRVFVLGADRMAGTLGDSPSPTSWPGTLYFAGSINGAQRETLNRTLSLPAEQFPAKLWLTTFEDRSFPRRGTDEVYFAPAPQQTSVTPPPVHVTRVQHIYVPVEPLVLVAGGGLFFGLTRLRKRAQGRSQGQ